jgi:membrane protease subunit (stomatin/prohibitin family)
MVPLFQVECPKCNAKNKSGARYCGKCGGRLPGSEQKCGNCGAMVPADKAFCGNCGKPLSESASPLMTGNRWARRTDDFATKVEVDDVEGFFKRGLIVEAGTKAIFFTNGAYSGILEPGRYDMGGLLQRVKNIFSYKTTTSVLIDTGDVELEFTMGGLATRDPIRLAAQCRLVVQMENPTQFFENMMKGRQNYTLSEMKSFLEGEIQNCLAEFVGGKTVQELSTNVAFKQQMEQGVAQHLATTFSRKGLSFVQVRIFDFRHPRMDAVTNQKEEYWLHAQDLETKLAGEGSTMGLDRKLLDQETAKELMQLEVFEDRAKVFDRMRKAVASDDMNKVTTETELEKFLQGIDKDKMLRHEEMRVLVQDFGEKKEDHDLARAHLIQRLKIEQNTDVARATLAGQISLNRTISESERNEEMGQLDHELAARRKEMEMRQAQEWAEIKQKAETRRLEVETELDLAKKKEQQELDLGKQRTVTEIDLDRKKRLSQIELDELDDQKDLRTASSSLDLLKKTKGIKKEEFDWELDRKLRERAGESEVTMREEALRHERELAKIQAISTLSTEALIAAAPADRAAMLADLKRTEGLKGFSEEQLLAMAADKSPEIARAFQEKFKSASSAEIQKAYEKMLDMKDASTKDLKEMSRDYAKMMQEMYNRGMDTQRDTATAAARSGQPDLTVIATGTGQPGVIHPLPPNIGAAAAKPPAGTANTGHGHVERVVVCPECHLETAEGAKFCENCGHKFFG